MYDIHTKANYKIIKLTNKLKNLGWSYQELEDLMNLPKDPSQIEIRQFRNAINDLECLYILSINQLNKS
tara:strand:+ start:587 stop:793 length:207 start_codon:yes stop_codon:yes gene_type:complete